MRLDGKTCLITGAAGGIGLAMTQSFLREGARIIMTDRDDALLNEKAALFSAVGDRLVARVLDVTDPEDVARITSEEFGIDVLVNNAAVISIGNLLDTTNDDLDRVMRVNLGGLLNVTRAILPGMIEKGGGTILNMASLAGVHAMYERFAYGASKAAIVMMTRSIAIDFVKQGVRANCICPARVHTEFVEGYVKTYYPDEFDARMQALASYQPAGRMIRADEVAEMAVYLCSDESAMVTGTSMIIDGGVTAGDH